MAGTMGGPLRDGWARWLVGLVGALGLGVVLSACHQEPVATFVVTSTTDGADAVPGDGICEMTPAGGDCSLRAAVDEANAFGQPVRVELGAGTYAPTGAAGEDANVSGDFDVSGAMEIVGTAPGVVIDASGGDRVFDLLAGSDVELENLTVTGGSTSTDGAGVRMAGQFLTATSVAVQDGVASGRGGGVATLSGVAVFDSVTVSGNLAGEAGGGLFTGPDAAAAVTNSTVSGNAVDPEAPSLPAGAGGAPEPLAPIAGAPELGGEVDPAPLRTSPATATRSAGGRSPVIVELDVDVLPEGALDAPAIRDQRARIAAATAEVGSAASADPAVRAQVRRTYTTVPYVAMTVAGDGRTDLESLEGVRSVQDDTLDAPSLSESIPWIGADVVHAAGHDGTDTAVAVIDSGVDATHVMTEPRVVEEACFSTGELAADGVGDCPNGLETQTGAGSGAPCADLGAGCWHGTHVATIAAGSGAVTGDGDTLIGVAPDADIIAINVFSEFSAPDCGPGVPKCILSWSSDQLAALDLLVTLTATHDLGAVNMSLGAGSYTSPCDGDSRKSAIDSLRWAGVPTVIASGNEGIKTGISRPACISTAVSVGATSDVADTVATFSNSHEMLDLLAPGENILAGYPGDQAIEASGTSMATPHVAGAFALLHDHDDTATVEELLAALRTSGVPVTDTNAITRPRIDLPGAIAALDAGVGGGGGIANHGLTDIRFSTITDNAADWGAGLSSTDALKLRATVIGSQAAGFDCAIDLGSTVTNHGYNADSDGSCGLESDGTSLSGIAPDLAALAANGSFPDTHLPNGGSPLIDAIPFGTSIACDGTVAVDQRGVARPTGGDCDIGSTEQ